MVESPNVEYCPICLEEPTDGYITPCQHLYCKECIVMIFLSDHENICPLCRANIIPQEVKSKETNENLIGPPKIVGSVYVQGSTEGLASYHFDSDTDCYISYSNPWCNVWPPLANGERPPHKKPFVNISIDEEKRIFCGDIQWWPNTWKGNALWSYEMHFSEDYNSIVSGQCTQYDSLEKTNSTDIVKFGVLLLYNRKYEYDFNLVNTRK